MFETDLITAPSSESIDWKKDDEETIVRKVNSRWSDAKHLLVKKQKEYREADYYLDGDPQKIDVRKKMTINNSIFPIIRNMTGLITDSRPHPSIKLTEIEENTPQEIIQKLLQNGDNLEKSLNNWWDDFQMQSRFQQITFSMQAYADFFVFPFWDDECSKDVQIELIHPRRVAIDPNAASIREAEYVVVDFFKSRQWMEAHYDKEKLKEVVYMDYSEARLYEMNDEAPAQDYKMMKNVCRLQLYMEREHWVYKVGNIFLEKKDNPFWVKDKESQKKDVEDRIRKKHKKGVVGTVVDKVKGAVGMENDESNIIKEIDAAMKQFEPTDNYFKFPKIPLIQFDTYRLAGEIYSRSIMKISQRMIDHINDMQFAITSNARNLGKPTVFVDGSVMGDNQAAKLIPQAISDYLQIVRVKTTSDKSIQQSIQIQQGVPMPGQFFDNIMHSERALDTLWGHHEVSKGASDPANRTRGGILALQEADQTPIRYLTRNIEDNLQELFGWVIQIRKIYFKRKEVLEVSEDNLTYLDYQEINSGYRVFIKSGSMMPVSREQQRADAMEMYRSSLLDPLTYFERTDDPNPEKTAKRLEAWLKNRTILTDQYEDAQKEVIKKIILIKENRFNEVQPLPTDDPKIHHDMLLLLLKSNTLTPEQENFTAKLMQQYIAMVEGSKNPPPGAGGQPPLPPNAPPPGAVPPEGAQPPPEAQPQMPPGGAPVNLPPNQ